MVEMMHIRIEVVEVDGDGAADPAITTHASEFPAAAEDFWAESLHLGLFLRRYAPYLLVLMYQRSSIALFILLPWRKNLALGYCSRLWKDFHGDGGCSSLNSICLGSLMMKDDGYSSVAAELK